MQVECSKVVKCGKVCGKVCGYQVCGKMCDAQGVFKACTEDEHQFHKKRDERKNGLLHGRARRDRLFEIRQIYGRTHARPQRYVDVYTLNAYTHTHTHTHTHTNTHSTHTNIYIYTCI
jgi:hypothetical protein